MHGVASMYSRHRFNLHVGMHVYRSTIGCMTSVINLKFLSYYRLATVVACLFVDDDAGECIYALSTTLMREHT
jgi:hypothetical protein